MHIAIGYKYFSTSVGYHIERALTAFGHTVTYVGLPHAQRAGFDSRVSIAKIIENLPQMPDFFLWIDPAGPYFPQGIETLAIPTVCYLIDVHLGHWRKTAAQFFDAVFVAQKNYLPVYKHAVGHNQVYWLPLAAATDVHHDWGLERIYDVGFVGNIARAHQKTARARRLKQISEKFHTNDFYCHYLPEDVGKIYSQSKIVFNTSITGDITMRVFEGTACGALMLTDKTENGINDLFVAGKELVLYENDIDLITKIEYFLAHPTKRETIARAGQQRTLAEHTYAHRATNLLACMNDATFVNLAPMRTRTAREQMAARRKIYIHLHMIDAVLTNTEQLQFSPWQRAWMSLPVWLRRILR